MAMEKRNRRPYWRRTKLLLLLGLLVPAGAVVALPFYVEELSHSTFLGFPLGYLLAAHGTVLIAVLAVLRFIAQQSRVDRRHGALDDI